MANFPISPAPAVAQRLGRLGAGILLAGGLALLLSLLIGLSAPATAAPLGRPALAPAGETVFPIAESFTYNTMSAGWILGNNASLTGGGWTPTATAGCA